MFAHNVITVAATEKLLPELNLEMRTVESLIALNERYPKITSDDLPNLELEYKDEAGETQVIWYNVKNMGRDYKPFRFDIEVMVFAEQVGRNHNLELIKRSHNATIKGIKGRIKDLAYDLYAPHLSARHIIDSVKAPRILRCQKDTTRFRAFRHTADMKEFMRQNYINGITGFFKLGDTVGYFIIDGLVAPLWCASRDGLIHDYIISDVEELVEAYKVHIRAHWPILDNLELYMKLSDVFCTDHFVLNQLAGEHFSTLKGKK